MGIFVVYGCLVNSGYGWRMDGCVAEMNTGWIMGGGWGWMVNECGMVIGW